MRHAFAATTSVPVERTRAEIEMLLRKHGATGFAYAWQESSARIEFLMKDRHLRFELMLPDRNDKQFTRSPGGRKVLGPDAREKAWEQACRSRWRALLLIIKAKLEAIAIGVSVFEQEFLAFIVAADGRTVGDIVVPQLQGGAPARLLLPAPRETR